MQADVCNHGKVEIAAALTALSMQDAVITFLWSLATGLRVTCLQSDASRQHEMLTIPSEVVFLWLVMQHASTQGFQLCCGKSGHIHDSVTLPLLFLNVCWVSRLRSFSGQHSRKKRNGATQSVQGGKP